MIKAFDRNFRQPRAMSFVPLSTAQQQAVLLARQISDLRLDLLLVM